MARADAGLTISELAERAGVARDTISKAEKGQHSLQASTLNKIARALGRTPSELLAEEERLAPKVERRSSLEPSLFNGVLDEGRRTPTDFEIRALGEWVSYLEPRLDELSPAEIKHEFAAASLFEIRKGPGGYPDELVDRCIQLMRRLLFAVKSFEDLEAETTQLLEADVNRLEDAYKGRQAS